MGREKLGPRPFLTQGERAARRAEGEKIHAEINRLNQQRKEAQRIREELLRSMAIDTRAILAKTTLFTSETQFARIDPQTILLVKLVLGRGAVAFLEDSDLAISYGLARHFDIYEIERGTDNREIEYTHPDSCLNRVIMRLNHRPPYSDSYFERFIPVDTAGRGTTPIMADSIFLTLEENMEFTGKIASSILSFAQSRAQVRGLTL